MCTFMVSHNIFFSNKTRTQGHRFLGSRAGPQASGHSDNTLEESDSEDEPPGGNYSLPIDQDDEEPGEQYTRDNRDVEDELSYSGDNSADYDPLSEVRTYVHESVRISLLEQSIEYD